MKEVLLAHENEHKKDWEKFINENLHFYNDLLNNYKPNCNDFNDVTLAKTKGGKKFRYDFQTKFLNSANNNYRIFACLTPETELLKIEHEAR